MTLGLPLRIDRLTKTFVNRSRRGRDSGELLALDATTLDVAAGEFIVLIGASGCGKTTLLRCIAGLEAPTSGTIAVGGLSAEASRAARRIGFVPQDPALLPWRSVLRNVTLLTDVNRAALPAELPDPEELIAHVGLAGFEHARPHELSGGMRQRVALARVFATGAPVLLMDEPFAALDEITRSDMRELLLDLWVEQRPTIVFTTHSLEEAVLLADRVVVMATRPGRVTDIIPVALPRPGDAELPLSAEFMSALTTVRGALNHARHDVPGAGVVL